MNLFANATNLTEELWTCMTESISQHRCLTSRCNQFVHVYYYIHCSSLVVTDRFARLQLQVEVQQMPADQPCSFRLATQRGAEEGEFS
jgi:hypothetical protein